MGMYAPCGLAGCALKGNRRLNSAYPPTARLCLPGRSTPMSFGQTASTHVRVDYRGFGPWLQFLRPGTAGKIPRTGKEHCLCISSSSIKRQRKSRWNGGRLILY